jgi:hypothetical protein
MRTTPAGQGVAQHAALAARAPRQDSTGAPTRRVALDMLSQSVGNRLGGDTINRTRVLNRVANLSHNYSPAVLDKAADIAIKGWAVLVR